MVAREHDIETAAKSAASHSSLDLGIREMPVVHFASELIVKPRRLEPSDVVLIRGTQEFASRVLENPALKGKLVECANHSGENVTLHNLVAFCPEKKLGFCVRCHDFEKLLRGSEDAEAIA